MAKNIQILYASDSEGNINKYFRDESEAMKSYGFIVGTSISTEAELAIYRGPTIRSNDSYPCDNRLIQGWNEYSKTLCMSQFLPNITDLSIPTEFITELDEDKVKRIMHQNKWERVFIKSDVTSLFAFGDTASVFPESSILQIKDHYLRLGCKGPFAVRQFIDCPQIFYEEQRYWVLNGHPHHPSGHIPQIVSIAAKRIYEYSNSHYFTIDCAGKYIVEVNPGESSDRGGENPLDFFAEIFANEFLK